MPAVLRASAATACLGAAVLTGASAQVGLVDTSGVRWIHHALFAATLLTCGATVARAQRPRRYLPAGLSLGSLALTRGRSRPHAVVAATSVVCWIYASRGAHRGVA
jgi:hypothetical protein